MLYIHQAYAISPQHSFKDILEGNITLSVNNQLKVVEPGYDSVPRNLLRRMGKAVRIGVGASVAYLQGIEEKPAIIIGTGYGGMEDSIAFLKQIMEYDEGMLTAGNFVQSTANATAAQISLMNLNRKYNITHVHRGLAFENAAIDAGLWLNEHPNEQVLLGGVDEISGYNYVLEKLAGLYKEEPVSNTDLFKSKTAGTIAGEGAGMFVVKAHANESIAKMVAIRTLHTRDLGIVEKTAKEFLQQHSIEKIDLLLTGENGDIRQMAYYETIERLMRPNIAIARFKHLCGEYPTATSFSTWLSVQILKSQQVPPQAIKRDGDVKEISSILMYNCYNFDQHSFILINR